MLTWPLNADERLLWQGRPAPRCYLFRHWRGQIVCIFALIVSIFMLAHSLQQEVSSGVSIIWALLVVIFLAVGPVRLILLRRRWETIFYAVTSQRLLMKDDSSQMANSFLLVNLQTVIVYPYTERLADIELKFADSCPILLECLEEPDTCLSVLPSQHQQKRH